jgi:hypothetical protein
MVLNITGTITEIIEIQESYNFIISKYYYLSVGICSIIITIFFIIYLNYDILSLYVQDVVIIRTLIKIINYLKNIFNKKKDKINDLQDDKYCKLLIKIIEYLDNNKLNIDKDYKRCDNLKKNSAISILYDIKRNNKYEKSYNLLLKIIKKIEEYKIRKDFINDIIIYFLIKELDKL